MRAIIVFEKGALLRHLGHLDLMRTMQRSLRRSGLPISYSQGFNPHVLVTFASALSVGVVGEREIMDVPFTEDVTADQVTQALKTALPPALTVREVVLADNAYPTPMARLAAADYTVRFYPGSEAALQTLFEAVPDYLAQKEIMAMRKTKSGEKLCDIRPMLFGMVCAEGCLLLRTMLSGEGTLKPELVLKTLAEKAGLPQPPAYELFRTQLLGKTPGGEYVPLEHLA